MISSDCLNLFSCLPRKKSVTSLHSSEIEENITIDIRRRHVGNEPPVIRPIDVESEFVMVHPQQKNQKPIFERPELKVRADD